MLWINMLLGKLLRSKVNISLVSAPNILVCVDGRTKLGQHSDIQGIMLIGKYTAS